MPAASRWSETDSSTQTGEPSLADVSLLQREAGRLAPQECLRQVNAGGEVVGVRDVLAGPLEQLLASVAEDGAELLVHAQEAAVEMPVADADGGVLERAAEPLLALAQSLGGCRCRCRTI